VHIEPDVEQHLDRTVGEVDVLHLQHRDVLGVGLLAFVLGHLLAELGQQVGVRVLRPIEPRPRRARQRASVAAIVVLPVPPLPETATFMSGQRV